MRAVVICSLIACLAHLANAQTCLYIANGNTFDLTSLNGQNFQVTMGMYIYTFYPCSNGCQGPTSISASLCQDDLSLNPVAPVSIFDSTMTWSTFSANGLTGIQYTTANGAPPLCSPSNKPRYATIQFVCQLTGTPTLTLTNEPNLQGCSIAPGYVFQLTTPLACPGYVPPEVTVTTSVSISGGWIFVIILCVVLPVYFIAGFIYGWKVKGQTGTEACPNIGFWRDLPGLIKEGFSFVITKIKGCCGGKGGGAGYDAL